MKLSDELTFLLRASPFVKSENNKVVAGPSMTPLLRYPPHPEQEVGGAPHILLTYGSRPRAHSLIGHQSVLVAYRVYKM